MRTATEQLPAFIFYLGAGAILLMIGAAIETIIERAESKREKVADRAELRARAWAEVERLS